MVFLVAIASVVGLLFGSFANVIIARVPLGRSIVSPPSACTSCGSRIKPWHNIPVLSWVLLKGRCAYCGGAISWRYPVIELAMALWWGLSITLWGPTWLATLAIALGFFGIILAAIDIDVQRLPNPIVASFALTVALLMVASVVFGEPTWSLVRACIGALSVGGLYFVAFVAYPRGMGFGDVKLAPVLGAVLGFAGWQQLVVGAFSAFVLGAAVGVAVMVALRQRSGVRIPFGPWMIAGAGAGLLWGESLSQVYFDLLF